MAKSSSSAVVVKHKITKKKAIIALLVILALALAAAPSYYFYTEYKKVQLQLVSPTQAAENEIEELEKTIGAFMILPQTEQPTLATVSDVDKLRQQDFFKNAQNGDKVLIYTEAKKAILYRPSIKRIVEVSPLQLTETTAPTPAASDESAEPTQSAPLKMSIYNGTATSGLSNDVEKEVLSKVQGVIVDEKDSAAGKNYTRTLVINVSGKATEAQILQIAKTLNAEVTNLPSTEEKPNTDVLVIVGTDKVATTKPATTTPAAGRPTSAPAESEANETSEE